ncbi:MAG: 16S rRNA methyltransferase [Thermoplasmata archaeon]|nr:MAG: 16S rRNA methyltransferase [Thermoplasmata archaeon]
MLTMILVDSELELVPRKLWGDPIIGKSAKMRGKTPETILLDDSYHHGALRRLPDGWRRGRPDIVHIFLNVVQDSILNKCGLLRVYVHTRNNQVIYVHPETRIIKHYMRFVGLMESLFQKKVLPSEEKPLIELYDDMSLKELLDNISPDIVITMHEKGDKVDLLDLFSKNKEKDIVVLIGGFPKGDFLSPVDEYSDYLISLYDEPLNAWVVAAEILVRYEIAHGIGTY